MARKIKVIFDGFDTPQQADAFISWYIAHGDTKSADWLGKNTDLAYAEGKLKTGDATKGEMTLHLKLTYKKDGKH